MTDFAKRLKAARERKGITQAALARKVGLSRATISRYESGERTRITKPIYERVAQAVGLDAPGNARTDSLDPEGVTLALRHVRQAIRALIKANAAIPMSRQLRALYQIEA